MRKGKLFIIVVLLFILSGTLNVFQYDKSKKHENYETAVEIALSYFNSQYRVGSIHGALVEAISSSKLYIGEQDESSNVIHRNFQHLSVMHRELTLLYGPISSYANYTDVSSLRENSIYDMFVDFSLFFECLGMQQEWIVSDTSGRYIDLEGLSNELYRGVRIVEDITGQLELIRSRSYDNKMGSDQEALADYLIKSAAYFKSQEIQENIKSIRKMNEELLSKISS
ncbi:hypothetical protein MH215_07055 [Paenibacillus sp. ACRSA]|uniref:hypothetical protein n=1 Tax=Paenibacillus sp. ACRSA TaxID=2918211 RepID=UPI001EF72227|nr:hypothetical protein [Paenibacillus sp. ACRSA]MCG7376746.1 hypothetical protein [Paenibacillus sp. ACRSA]